MRFRSLVLVLSLATVSQACAQEEQRPMAEYVPPTEARYLNERLHPVRIELRETTPGPDGEEDLDAWIHLTLDLAQSWGIPMYSLHWNGMTWNGTGIDLLYLDMETMSVAQRITPIGIPLGLYLESFHYPGFARRVQANPDSNYLTSDDELDAFQPQEVEIPDTGVNNFISIPFVLSNLELEEGEAKVIPDWSTYSQVLRFMRVENHGSVEIEDVNGETHSATHIRGESYVELSDAEIGNRDSIRAVIDFYVRPTPPYVIGFDRVRCNDEGQEEVFKRWRLGGYQTIDVSTYDNLEAILEARRLRLEEEGPQDLPWQIVPE